MSVDKIPDYKVHLNLLMEQWKASPNLVTIITAALDRGNDMEDAIFEVQDLTNLDIATGINLDILGKPWNEARDNRGDEEYRTAILQKKLEYYSGTPEEIISILKASYGATGVHYYPQYPGKYITVSDSTITQPQQDEVSMAGVTGFLGGYIIDEAGDYVISFGGFDLGNLVAENGDNIIDFVGEQLGYVIKSLSSGRMIHVDN